MKDKLHTLSEGEKTESGKNRSRNLARMHNSRGRGDSSKVEDEELPTP